MVAKRSSTEASCRSRPGLSISVARCSQRSSAIRTSNTSAAAISFTHRSSLRRSEPRQRDLTHGLHRSTDCGHTWEGPFVFIDSASNPNGFVDDFGNPFDAADKEQIDVDRATGRVIVSWTNFSLELEISTSYSDNVLAPVPTWSPRVIVGARPGVDGQAPTPRFGPFGSN